MLHVGQVERNITTLPPLGIRKLQSLRSYFGPDWCWIKPSLHLHMCLESRRGVCFGNVYWRVRGIITCSSMGTPTPWSPAARNSPKGISPKSPAKIVWRLYSSRKCQPAVLSYHGPLGQVPILDRTFECNRMPAQSDYLSQTWICPAILVCILLVSDKSGKTKSLSTSHGLKDHSTPANCSNARWYKSRYSSVAWSMSQIREESLLHLPGQ